MLHDHDQNIQYEEKKLIILNVDAKRSLSTTINRKWEQ
jgi:hypothetical protein